MDDLITRRKAFEYFVTLWECIGTIMDRDEWEDVCMTTANEIPSAQTDLSGYSDRLWKRAYASGYERCRQDAIDAINHICPVDTEYDCTLLDRVDVRCVLSDLPSAQPEQRWIPCSERLPENGHYYLWCSDMGSVQSDYYWDGFENGMKYGYNIVAWMPLPECYRGDK